MSSPSGGGGGKASPDGEGQDDFVFTLSKDEFLDVFFEDLKLPNLVKTKLKDMKSPVPQRAGYTTDGPPAKMRPGRPSALVMARRYPASRLARRGLCRWPTQKAPFPGPFSYSKSKGGLEIALNADLNDVLLHVAGCAIIFRLNAQTLGKRIRCVNAEFIDVFFHFARLVLILCGQQCDRQSAELRVDFATIAR